MRLILLLAVLLCACSSHKVTSTAVTRYPIEGQVLKLRPDEHTATLKHKEIKGWMGAMTMDYLVPSKADFAKLQEGAPFKGTVFVQDQEFWVGDIQDNPGKP